MALNIYFESKKDWERQRIEQERFEADQFLSDASAFLIYARQSERFKNGEISQEEWELASKKYTESEDRFKKRVESVKSKLDAMK